MVNEKALMRQMRENWRGSGYRVGTIMISGQELLMIAGVTWAVAMPAREAGNELKAQIVRHTGQMPGRCVKVQKDSGAQLEIDGDLGALYQTLFGRSASARACRETEVSLGGCTVWQDESGRCLLFDGGKTGMVMEDPDTPMERVMEEQCLILDSGFGKLYLLAVKPNFQQEEQLRWMAGFSWNGLPPEE